MFLNSYLVFKFIPGFQQELLQPLIQHKLQLENTFREDYLKTTHSLKTEIGVPLHNQEATSPHQILLTPQFVIIE
jgi:hypothetical protein